MAVSTIKKDYDFRGVDGARYEDFGVTQNITPSHDGWWVVTWTETSNSPFAIAYISQNGIDIACMSGIGFVSGTCLVTAPVKAGLNYSVIAYRGSVKSSRVYY